MSLSQALNQFAQNLGRYHAIFEPLLLICYKPVIKLLSHAIEHLACERHTRGCR